MRPTQRLGLVCLGAFFLAITATEQAWAQGAADKAAAETLFEEGRKLMAEGRAPEACPKFAASQKLDPGLGTLLNLGDCYEKTGKTASAWAHFREAASLAQASGDTRRAEVAQKRASRLEPRLARLTIKADERAPASLKVELDGVSYDKAALNLAMPVDPGRHKIVVIVPGKTNWVTEIEVPEEKAELSVQIPELEEAPPSAVAVPGAQPGSPQQPIVPEQGTSATGARRWSGQHTAAVIVGGVGLASLGVSAVFGLQARSKWSDAQDRCPDGYCGSQSDVDLGSDARSAANVATVFGAVGLAGIAAGAALWFTAPSRRAGTVTVGVGGGPGTGPGLSLGGRF